MKAWTYIIALLLYGIAVFFGTRSALSQEFQQTAVMCMPVEVLVKTASQRGELIHKHGDVFPDPKQSPYKIILFFNKDDGQFTVAAVNKETGRACILAAGYNWMEAEKKPNG